MKQSYNNENLHNGLTLKIKEFIDSMEEFETTPFYQTEEGYQKSFGVLSDNGNFNVMKRFTITVEDHKLENNNSEKMGSIQEENPYHPDGVSGFSGMVGPDGGNGDLTTKTFNQNKMELTLEEAICIILTGWRTEEEKELLDIAYNIIRKKGNILYLNYQKIKIEEALINLQSE
jgi:hypothetical protein